MLDNVAAGVSPDEIVASYPPITHEDIRAALAYAAELARERLGGTLCIVDETSIRIRGVGTWPALSCDDLPPSGAGLTEASARGGLRPRPGPQRAAAP